MALFGFRSGESTSAPSEEERQRRQTEADRIFQTEVIAVSRDKPVVLLLADGNESGTAKFRRLLQETIGSKSDIVALAEMPCELAVYAQEDVGLTQLPLAASYYNGKKVGVLFADGGSKSLRARNFLSQLFKHIEEEEIRAAERRRHTAELPRLIEEAEAFFNDTTSIASFDVDAYFAAQNIKHADYKAFYEKYQPTQQGIPLGGSNFQLATGAIGAIVTAGRAGAISSGVNMRIRHYRAERSLFFMSEREREIFRHMKMLCLTGAITQDTYDRFERGIIFNGGNCVFIPTHDPDDYTGLAQVVLTEFLGTRLMSPLETLHYAVKLFNQIKRAIAAEKVEEEAAKEAPALPPEADLGAVQKILDDI